MRLSTRGGLRAAAALLAATALAATAACGAATATSDTAEPDTDTTGAFPRTVVHAMGETEIPTQPERVVVLDSGELDDVTLLGIEPVGAVSPHMKTSGGFPEYLSAMTADTVDVGPMEEPDLEKIAELAPDLILSSKIRHEAIYADLAAIAPTVFTETTGVAWKENLAVHAEALGLEDEAAESLQAYEAQAASLGALIQEANGGAMPTVSVVRFLAGPTRLYQKATFSGVILEDVGVLRPESQDVDDFALEVGPEQIDLADADLVFVTVADDPEKTEQEAAMDSPLWAEMEAVQNGKVFNVADEIWMSGIGIQAARLVLADLAEAAGVELPSA
jgi:iron complex transport system substrate-binding protein